MSPVGAGGFANAALKSRLIFPIPSRNEVALLDLSACFNGGLDDLVEIGFVAVERLAVADDRLLFGRLANSHRIRPGLRNETVP